MVSHFSRCAFTCVCVCVWQYTTCDTHNLCCALPMTTSGTCCEISKLEYHRRGYWMKHFNLTVSCVLLFGSAHMCAWLADWTPSMLHALTPSSYSHVHMETELNFPYGMIYWCGALIHLIPQSRCTGMQLQMLAARGAPQRATFYIHGHYLVHVANRNSFVCFFFFLTK